MNPSKSIMLIEDDKIDAMTVKRALKELAVPNQLVISGNGDEALDFLNDINNPKPCIIIMDINMPKMNGIEFLKTLKSDFSLRSLPVIILTTSRQESDRVDSFNHGVAGYMIKPVDYDQFLEVMKSIVTYWTTSELPPT